MRRRRRKEKKKKKKNKYKKYKVSNVFNLHNKLQQQRDHENHPRPDMPHGLIIFRASRTNLRFRRFVLFNFVSKWPLRAAGSSSSSGSRLTGNITRGDRKQNSCDPYCTDPVDPQQGGWGGAQGFTSRTQHWTTKEGKLW